MRIALVLLFVITTACSAPASRSFLQDDETDVDLAEVPTDGDHCLGNKCLFSFENNETKQHEWYMIHKQEKLRETFRIDCASEEGVQNLLGIHQKPMLLDLDVKTREENSFAQHYKPELNPTLACVPSGITAPNKFFEIALRLDQKIYYYYTLPDSSDFKAFAFDAATCGKELELFDKTSGGIPIETVTDAADLVPAQPTLMFDCTHNTKAIVFAPGPGWSAYKAKGQLQDGTTVYFMLVRHQWPDGGSGDFVIGQMKAESANRAVERSDLATIESWLTENFANIAVEEAMPSPFGDGLGAEIWQLFDQKPVLAFDAGTQQLTATTVTTAAPTGKAKRLVFRAGTEDSFNRTEEVNVTTLTYPAFNFKKGLGRLAFGDGSAAFASLQTIEGTPESKSTLHLLERCDGEYWKGYLDYLGLGTELQDKDKSWNQAKYYERALYDTVEQFSSKVATKTPHFNINRLPCVRKVAKSCDLKINSEAQLTSFLRGEAAAFEACEDAAAVTDLHVHVQKTEGLAQDFHVKGAFNVGGIENAGFRNNLPALQNLIISGDSNQPTSIKLDCGNDCFVNRDKCPRVDRSTNLYSILAFENIPSVTLRNLIISPDAVYGLTNDPLFNRQAAVSFTEVPKAILQNTRVETFDVDATKSIGFGTGLCSVNSNLLVQGSTLKAMSIGILAQNGTQIVNPDVISFESYDGKSQKSPEISIAATKSTIGRAIEISQEARLLLNRVKLESARGIYLEGILPDAEGSKFGPSFIASQTNFVSPPSINPRVSAAIDIHLVTKKPSYVLQSTLGTFNLIGTAITGPEAVALVPDSTQMNNVIFEGTPKGGAKKKTDARNTDVFNLCSTFDDLNNRCLSLFAF